MRPWKKRIPSGSAIVFVALEDVLMPGKALLYLYVIGANQSID